MDMLLCGFPKETVSLGIGGLHAVIYFGLFLWKLADSIAHMMQTGSLGDVLLWILMNDMLNTEILVGCLFSITLIYGIKQRLPGFILAWMMGQVIFITSSILTVIYFSAAPYLKISIGEGLIELVINGVLVVFLIIVYSHFEELRKGNLLNEEV